MNDFLLVFAWWVIVGGLGLVFLPLTFHFFGSFWDKGYSLSKIIALLVISYFVWLLGSLKILPFTSQTIWLIVALATGFNFWLFRRQTKTVKKLVHTHQRIFIFEEALFLVALLFWAWIRGFQPNIQGLEKFMDYGFVNSILRARWFPPADMWLAGKSINYYYFGHLATAVLTKLSGLDSAITYNLMMALLFAFTMTASFTFGSNLFAVLKKNDKKTKKIVFAGLATALLVSLGGNLHPLYWWLTNHNFSAYWYPDATRFIVEKFGAADNTIHEFPLYSFVVADLHGHLLNLPFVLLFLSLVLSFFFTRSPRVTRLTRLTWSTRYLGISLLLAVFFMTNTWDFPIYFLIFGLATLYLNFTRYRRPTQALGSSALTGLICLGLALLFSLPYHLHFENITQGVALTDFHSPVWMLPVLWGWPLMLTLTFIGFSFWKKNQWQNTDNVVLIMVGVSWLLILIPEFIYVKDIYIHSHQRANTMFKLTYQAFVMFGLTAPYIILRVISNLKNKLIKALLITACLLLIAFIAIYPRFAIRSYYGLKNYQGLYGLTYLQTSYPDDYQAILWLRENISGQPVIVEAVGESYTDFARVSANTGLPTILGWRVHEWLWRGSFDEAGKRTDIVQQIYETADPQQTKQLLRQYQAKYIFIGALERQQYVNLNEEKFRQLGEVVFASGETKIYQLVN